MTATNNTTAKIALISVGLIALGGLGLVIASKRVKKCRSKELCARELSVQIV